ncbi:MAG: hypothetical protein Q8L74_06645 [Nitrospirota bacterium]|nr:hypothetical protein [Nitrospirota bacterium]MDP2384629.1 hypothetical protein [Nitrospirota bacterium]MDP3598423.1 hypothetical protein [Nitrospirota bacterium]
MWALSVIAVFLLIMGPIEEGRAEEGFGTNAILTIAPKDLPRILPAESHLLIDPLSIEQFLDALDGAPPDWAMVYGHGHHDPEHDERLFALNRERDANRAGKEALNWAVAFRWAGELSRFESEVGGFTIAMGPIFTATRWGMVRFKAEDLPGNLVAIPGAGERDRLRRQVEAGQKIEIEILMIGRLIPEESLIYDFSHDEEGLGLIMPVVRVERVEYLLAQ